MPNYLRQLLAMIDKMLSKNNERGPEWTESTTVPIVLIGGKAGVLIG